MNFIILVIGVMVMISLFLRFACVEKPNRAWTHSARDSNTALSFAYLLLLAAFVLTIIIADVPEI